MADESSARNGEESGEISPSHWGTNSGRYSGFEETRKINEKWPREAIKRKTSSNMTDTRNRDMNSRNDDDVHRPILRPRVGISQS